MILVIVLSTCFHTYVSSEPPGLSGESALRVDLKDPFDGTRDAIALSDAASARLGFLRLYNVMILYRVLYRGLYRVLHRVPFRVLWRVLEGFSKGSIEDGFCHKDSTRTRSLGFRVRRGLGP